MKKLLIAYDYFHPAWRAGGIIRSLVGLVEDLAGSGQVYVVCRHADLGADTLSGVPSGRWVSYKEGTAQVYYASDKQPSLRWWLQILREVQPDMLYVNGIFSRGFNILPLLAAHAYGKAAVCLAPRGMLQAGALAQKPLRKWVFLRLAKAAGLYRRVVWHATDAQEAMDIRRHFPGEQPIHRLRVIQDTPAWGHKKVGKQRQGNRLVTLSLIAPKKNQHTALEAVRRLPAATGTVVYHLYGPIADQGYWKRCEELLRQMPTHVDARYMGAVPPDAVEGVLAGYDYFLLPTLGENFGHAIAEALGAGVPVLTSPYTPWKTLERRGAGRIADPTDPHSVMEALLDIIRQDAGAYAAMSAAAVDYLASTMGLRDQVVEQYRQMLLP